jgi:hypothetical protein
LGLRFLPPKDALTKLNSNALALLEASCKIVVEYNCKPIDCNEVTTSNAKTKAVDIEVMSSLAGIVNIV